MSRVLNAVKDKLNNFKHSVLLRTVVLSALMLVLICSVTLAWYINNLGLWGMEFNTGYIDFNTYVYDADGTLLVGPVASSEENETKYMNAPLITIDNAEVGTIATAYIAVETTGTIGIEYRIAFDISGRNDKSNAYLGGYKYNITKVTDKVSLNGADSIDVSACSVPDSDDITDEVVTIDKNAVNGAIETQNDYHIYRVDFMLAEKNEEYTGNEINIYFNIFATQIGGDFDSTDEKGRTYYCSTKEDIDRAKIEAYPGDIIKLSCDVTYTGDLVFNKPVNLETNDFTLTVSGNLMYDYVLGNALKIDAGGLGRVVVECTKDGVGGNFQIKAPVSEVSIIGSNSSVGDISVEKNLIIDATNSYGASGVSFNEVKIVDSYGQLKTVQLESNTRATVSFGTTIGSLNSVVKANNIEIVNNGTIKLIDLSNMALLSQTNSPQIYILNNSVIEEAIVLPYWSEKFVMDEDGNCTGNTKIVQSYSASTTTVSGECDFTDDDIDVERKDLLVEQINEGNDTQLRIYYQGESETIESILTDYLKTSSTGCTLNEIVRIEIISIDAKSVTATDLSFMNGNSMLALSYLDMKRADMQDNTLPASAFYGVTKYQELVLPQNLTAIGDNAFRNSDINNIITIPSGVETFGTNWFYNGDYVRFASSLPLEAAIDGLTNVKAIFVDEAYIASYKSVYSTYATRIYPTSVMDDTKTHFVRNIASNEWEITYLVSDSDSVIGENITIDKTILQITSVYDNAYRHNFTGTSVRFADSVESLGAANFINMKNITDADLNHLKYIGDDAFSGAAALKTVVFGEYLETIGANAFLNCTSLSQDVILPDTMQEIGASAFQNTIITGVNTGGTTAIGGKAFYNCAELIYAELPCVASVGSDGSNSLFQFCSMLVSVRIPSLVKADGSFIFRDCVSLREIYMSAVDDSLSLGGDAYWGCTTAKLKLYVPEDVLEFYRNKRPGGINIARIYPEGEKMGEELVNDFNIGAYIVKDNVDGTCSLITSNLNYTGTLIIPETYNDMPITSIYDHAFRNQELTEVTMTVGSNITSIGDYAFYQLSGLGYVDFGTSLESIGSYAFAQCSNLAQNIILPESMQFIGSYAFYKSALLSIDTGGTKSVEGYAFSNCAAIIYANMPEVAVIGESGTNHLFYNSGMLVSVDMPKTMTINGAFMFRACTSLAEIYMGSSDATVSLGDQPFYDATIASQIKLYVPENLVSFYQDRGIISASQIYPRGEKVGDTAVNGFVIGDYVVLENDDGYTLVTSNLDYEGDAVIPGTYLNQPITEIYANAFRNQTFTDANLILSDNVTAIGDGAFYGCAGLLSITMDRVTEVGASAFYGSGLLTLNAPKLTTIGASAFRYCTALETVSVPRIVNIDNSYVFANCTSLTSVYFEDVLSLNQYTFYADLNLEKITINRIINSSGSNMPSTMTIEANAPCKIYVPYASKAMYGSIWSGKEVVSFNVAATYNGDTYIFDEVSGRYTLIAFEPGQSYTSLTLPETVTATEIGDITISAIKAGAFSSLSATLQTLTMSSTIANLSGSALSECLVLENIYVNDANAYFTSVNGILYSADGRILVKYPAGRSGSFDMTASAYAATVAIGQSAFANTTGLTKIVFPSSLLVIESSAFESCTGLHTVEFTGDTPPILTGAGVFDTTVENFVMIIPTSDANVVAAYQSAYNYAEYVAYMQLP